VTAAVILAAGASRRMGQPKASLQFQGESFLERMVRLLGRFCSPVIVVVRNGMAVPAGVIPVENPDPERGMLSSLQCGLASLPAGPDPVVFTPMDYPAVRESTIAAVCAGAGEIVIPRYQGLRGHPVKVSRKIVDELLALPATASPKDVMRAHYANYVDVDDPGAVRDVDEPADYEELLRSAC